jgi:hypothetical protein
MIVTTTAGPSRTVADGADLRWRCLARRGMVHSECEAVDHVAVPANTEFAPSGTEGVESAWLVISGDGQVGDQPVEAGDVILSPTAEAVTAGPDGVELLWIVVLPDEVSRALPARRPVVS